MKRFLVWADVVAEWVLTAMVLPVALMKVWAALFWLPFHLHTGRMVVVKGSRRFALAWGYGAVVAFLLLAVAAFAPLLRWP